MSKGELSPFLDKLRERRLGLIPLTLVLSLRSRCFKLVFLALSIILLSGWISTLLSKTVSKV